MRTASYWQTGIVIAGLCWMNASGATIDNVNGGPPGDGWSIEFEDNFDGSAIDPTKWDVLDNIEVHTSAATPECLTLAQNVTVGDGVCSLTTKREQVDEQHKYTAGSINTSHTCNFKAGRYIEARIRAPRGEGLWTTWWTTSRIGWPPEIDLVEIWDSGWPNVCYQTWHAGNMDFEQFKVWGNETSLPWQFGDWGNGWYDDYHIWAADWEEDRIDFYIDGYKTGTTTASVPLDAYNPQYMIIEEEGNGGWAPPLNENTPLPASILVDWVRVWSKSTSISLNATNNRAHYKRVTADSEDSLKNNLAAMAVDGIDSEHGYNGTGWSPGDGEAGHWLNVDLAQTYDLSGIKITWDAAQNYKYTIEVSSNDTAWAIAVDKTNATSIEQVVNDAFTMNNIRFIRITTYTAWAKISEFEVYGTIAGDATCIALSKPFQLAPPSRTTVLACGANGYINVPGKHANSSFFAKVYDLSGKLQTTVASSQGRINLQNIAGAKNKIFVVIIKNSP